MIKSFKTDSERNAYFTHMSTLCNQPDNIKYVNGVLYKDNIVVTDNTFITTMKNMFNALDKLSDLNKNKIMNMVA